MKKRRKKVEPDRRKGKKKRRGLSTVIITLIVILVSLVAIGILWVAVRNVIQRESEQVSLGQFTLDAQIMGLSVNNVSNNVIVAVRRNPGPGQMNDLDFIFSDGENSEVITETAPLVELEERTFDIHLNDISVYNLTDVSIAQASAQSGAPVIEVLDNYEINQETVVHVEAMPIEPSLMLWLKCDDSLSDNKTIDSSNYSHNGTCSGISCPIYLPTEGVDGSGAYGFDGGLMNNSVTIPTPLVNPEVWTYAAWFYPKSNVTATSGIIGQGNNPALRWVTSGGTIRKVYLFLYWSYSPGYKQIGSPDLTLNQWHHVVGIVNTSDSTNQTMYLYIDGVRVASAFWINGTIGRPSSAHYLNIRDSARTFNGSMDNIRVYNRSLSEHEILLLNSTKT